MPGGSLEEQVCADGDDRNREQSKNKGQIVQMKMGLGHVWGVRCWDLCNYESGATQAESMGVKTCGSCLASCNVGTCC